MMHRLREAMRDGGLKLPMGGDGNAVEVDETYIGRVKGVTVKMPAGQRHKNAVLSLVDRDDEASSQLPHRFPRPLRDRSPSCARTFRRKRA